MESPSTAVVLLNWNGAADTIECIESLLLMQDRDFLVVVCDNNSADGSFHVLQHWGESNLGSAFAIWALGSKPALNARIVLIQTGENLGFAGGCNVGIRYSLLHSSVQYIWLLNNDTIVEENALGAQLKKMESRPDIGILGSTLVFFQEPDRVQATAGYGFNFWTARVLTLFEDVTPANLPSESLVEKRLEYISGASMFVRRSLIEAIGLLNEQYFLYFEEVDWAVRSKRRYHLGYCAASTVYHKEGRSIGSHRLVRRRSSFSERYLARNRVLFLRTYFPWRIAVCVAWVLCVGFARLLKGNPAQAANLWIGALKGLFAGIRSLPERDKWPPSMSST